MSGRNTSILVVGTSGKYGNAKHRYSKYHERHEQRKQKKQNKCKLKLQTEETEILAE